MQRLEAKHKVSWRDPDETYETAVCSFARKLLDTKNDFLKAFIPFQQKVAWCGIVNSLTQLTLKCTSPGIQDIYQGTELWDLTLVDPDNRQPVDYEERHRLLTTMIAENKANAKEMLHKLSQNPFDGKIKLWLTYTLLNLRKKNHELFLQGNYIPLNTEGELKNNLMAYARIFKEKGLLVVVPLVTADLSYKPYGEYLKDLDWESTRIILPENAKGDCNNILTGEKHITNGSLKASEVFRDISVGLMVNW